MKKTVLILVLLLVGMTTQSLMAKPAKKQKNNKATSAIELRNETDSAAYALGVSLGGELERMLAAFPGDSLDRKVLFHAMQEAFFKQTLALDYSQAQAFMDSYIKKVQEKEAELNKRKQADFLAENAKRPEVVTLPSGLQYEVIIPADGPKPTATTEVKVHYEGRLIDGTKFDSSYDRKQPASFQLNRVIPGWTEGVQLMSRGAKYKFYVPYQLGYGERGAGKQIPPYATLVFVVELLEF